MCHMALDDIAETMRSGGDVPAELHDACTMLIPKAWVGQGAETTKSAAGRTHHRSQPRPEHSGG